MVIRANLSSLSAAALTAALVASAAAQMICAGRMTKRLSFEVVGPWKRSMPVSGAWQVWHDPFGPQSSSLHYLHWHCS
jgi:acetyl-CoA acetyltransferase